MLEKIEKLQIVSLGILIGLALVVSTKMAASTIQKNEISVTGSAFEIVKSDKGSFNFDIEVKKPTRQEAYKTAQENLKVVKQFLKDKKIEKIEVKTPNAYAVYKNDSRGYSTNEVDHYNYTQPVSVSADNVELIKEVSADIAGLINQGIVINVYTPSYDYSKLPDLKVTLLEKASNDARKRAESMLKPSHNHVGKISAVRMGVYQITPVDSTDVSDMGINDASSIDKKVTAVANVTFRIK
jgi:hypothetical protein